MILQFVFWNLLVLGVVRFVFRCFDLGDFAIWAFYNLSFRHVDLEPWDLVLGYRDLLWHLVLLFALRLFFFSFRDIDAIWGFWMF